MAPRADVTLDAADVGQEFKHNVHVGKARVAMIV
jgi:hypothetical protein